MAKNIPVFVSVSMSIKSSLPALFSFLPRLQVSPRVLQLRSHTIQSPTFNLQVSPRVLQLRSLKFPSRSFNVQQHTTKMKLLFAFTFAFVATTLAIPSELNPLNHLEPRDPIGKSCRVKSGGSQRVGNCVDASKCGTCKGGDLVQGGCPGGCNIICCVDV